jgi:hypothetical protein
MKNKLEKKGMCMVDMMGKKVNSKKSSMKLSVGGAKKNSTLDTIVAKNDFQKLMRGGSKSSC